MRYPPKIVVESESSSFAPRPTQFVANFRPIVNVDVQGAQQGGDRLAGFVARLTPRLEGDGENVIHFPWTRR